MCVKFIIPVRGVSSFMDSSAGIGVGTCIRRIEYRKDRIQMLAHV